jgi:hypothetical protein
MPGNGKGRDQSAATDRHRRQVAQASAWKTIDRTMILNIANEWGPSSMQRRLVHRRHWAPPHRGLPVHDRGLGRCGQDNDDPPIMPGPVRQRSAEERLFDQHIYGNWANGNGQSWQIDLKTGLDRLVATGLPVTVGEFGPGRGIGPSPTDITPHDLMQECEARGIGWMAWAWDDPASNADDTWFALSRNGDYNSSADLTQFGRTVVEDPTYGLVVLARPATSF